MNKVVMLHGRWPEKIDGKLIADIPECDSNNPNNWMGWTKERLQEKGYDVQCPIVSDAWKATYQEWKQELDKCGIDENTILVGLSAGAYALLRWLGESGKSITKLILMAPASKILLEDKNRDKGPSETEFYEYEITETLQSQIKEGTTIIVSNDDYPGILKSVERYERLLAAKVVQLEGLGHLSFLIKTLPELLEEIVSDPIQKAGAVILRHQMDSEPEILLLFRHRQKDWSFPKGHRERGETMGECMRREIEEETGLKVNIVKELPPLEYQNSNGESVKLYMYLVSPSDIEQKEKLEHTDDSLEWVKFSAVEERLSYQNLKDYFRSIQSMI